MVSSEPVSPQPDSAETGEGSTHPPSKEEQEEQEVDLKQAMLDDPIVGVEIISTQQHGAGARSARPLPTPKP